MLVLVKVEGSEAFLILRLRALWKSLLQMCNWE